MILKKNSDLNKVKTVGVIITFVMAEYVSCSSFSVKGEKKIKNCNFSIYSFVKDYTNYCIAKMSVTYLRVQLICCKSYSIV